MKPMPVVKFKIFKCKIILTADTGINISSDKKIQSKLIFFPKGSNI
jgi:hypothetical protein